MNIDYLMSLKPDSLEFEAERKRLITASLLKVPEEHRATCEALQAELDVARMSMSSDDFMRFISKRLAENIDNLQDQINALHVQIEKDSVVKPRFAKFRQQLSINWQ